MSIQFIFQPNRKCSVFVGNMPFGEFFSSIFFLKMNLLKKK